MLPTPLANFIPKTYRRDAGLTALADKADTHMAEWKADILRIAALIDPARIPNNLLVEMGTLLAAGIVAEDSDRTKREKISNAIMGHKQRGLWEEDAKPKIDAIAGGNAVLVSFVGEDDFIIVGDGLTPLGHFWSVVGGDGIATDYGIRIVGEGTESVLKGLITIDVDNDSLTADEILQLENALADVVPAYYRIVLGYFNGSGDFVTYTIIG